MSYSSLFKDQDTYSQWGGSEGVVWKKNETPDEYDDEYTEDTIPFIPNNKEFVAIQPEFKESLLNAKHKLYEESVLKPDENSTASQNIDLMELYETYLKMFYLLAEQAKNNKPISSVSLALFPSSTISLIKDILKWISKFYSSNTPRETLPYSHYLDFYLHTNPFFQDDLFIDNKNRK